MWVSEFMRFMRTLYGAHIWSALLFFGRVGLRMMCSVVLEVLRYFVAVHVQCDAEKCGYPSVRYTVDGVIVK